MERAQSLKKDERIMQALLMCWLVNMKSCCYTEIKPFLKNISMQKFKLSWPAASNIEHWPILEATKNVWKQLIVPNRWCQHLKCCFLKIAVTREIMASQTAHASKGSNFLI